MKKNVIGILAHVDAGKTTLSESILYLTGSIRKLGRVDNRDAFLDTYEMERARGITIFSKQAIFSLGDTTVTLVDTPGHVDFSPEMERTLQILDYGILVVSGTDGVQGHTETLWKLLKRYKIPVFVFVNKMDQPGTDRERLTKELKARLDGSCVDFGLERDLWMEELAMCDEGVLETYLEQGTVGDGDVRQMIRQRKVFPCFFGSALKLQGVEEFLLGLKEYCTVPEYPAEFGARVFKISRDSQGNRMTHMKITGGMLRVRDLLSGKETEKINQIRLYSGSRFEPVNEAGPGTVCAVTGPVTTCPGQGMGLEREAGAPVLEPVLNFSILLPEDVNVQEQVRNLKQLEEEEPQLHIVWDQELQEIQAQVMGQVQMEIVKGLVKERFGLDVEFGPGRIVYKETIARAVEGVGHFEPLRHYAEVHLLMEPGERGSGLQLESACSEDVLDRNWQRLVLTHLEEKLHRGVLTGSVITDMKITLITGRAHLKHTEGGDFRQATYRAVRQGLMEAGCRLLEPYYAFRLELPAESVGRAMMDLERLNARFQPPDLEGDLAVLTGTGPVSTLGGYAMEVTAYTRGRGRFSCSLAGYDLCHNEEEVVEALDYDPELDLANPTGSVFCAHGAGYVVPWYEVKQHMQVESPLASGRQGDEELGTGRLKAAAFPGSRRASGPLAAFGAEDKELEAIFTRTYGEGKRNRDSGRRQVEYDPGKAGTGQASGRGSGRGQRTPSGHTSGSSRKNRHSGDASGQKPTSLSGQDFLMGRPGYFRPGGEGLEDYLLVDGYNIIYAWEDLRDLAEVTIDGARQKLMDILCNYQAYYRCSLIVVFDAYKVTGNPGSAMDYHNIHVVYTKEAETADQYIEKFAHQMGRRYRVTVATSDGLEQLIIRGQGCLLMSASDLKEDIERIGRLTREAQERLPKPAKASMLQDVDDQVKQYLADLKD